MSYIVLNIAQHTRPMPNRRNGRSWREYDSKARIYVWEEGETILQNLVNRRSRPTKLYRELLKDQPFMQGARWSRTAGCGCGCSPGFIAAERIRTADTFQPVDYHVTICAEADLYNAISSIAQMTAAMEPVVDTSWIELAEAA